MKIKTEIRYTTMNQPNGQRVAVVMLGGEAVASIFQARVRGRLCKPMIDFYASGAFVLGQAIQFADAVQAAVKLAQEWQTETNTGKARARQ